MDKSWPFGLSSASAMAPRVIWNLYFRWEQLLVYVTCFAWFNIIRFPSCWIRRSCHIDKSFNYSFFIPWHFILYPLLWRVPTSTTPTLIKNFSAILNPIFNIFFVSQFWIILIPSFLSSPEPLSLTNANRWVINGGIQWGRNWTRFIPSAFVRRIGL